MGSGRAASGVKPADLTSDRSRDTVTQIRHDKAAVVFRAGLGVPNWQARDAQSPVPGRWPYGLDGLADSGLETQAVEAPASRWWRRAIPHPVRTALRAVKHRRPAFDIALCWDEQTLGPMLDSISARRYFSGVIWATDRAAAGAPSSDLDELA